MENIITCTYYRKVKFISQLLYCTRIITRNLRGTRRGGEVGRGKGLLPWWCGPRFCSVFHAVFPHGICDAISNGHHHPHQVRPGKHKTNTGKVDSCPMYNEQQLQALPTQWDRVTNSITQTDWRCSKLGTYGHSSRSSERTRERWVPRFLWIPEHSIQTMVPRLILAQSGSTKDTKLQVTWLQISKNTAEWNSISYKCLLSISKNQGVWNSFYTNANCVLARIKVNEIHFILVLTRHHSVQNHYVNQHYVALLSSL